MKIVLKIIAPVAILVLAVLGFKFLGSLRPEPESRVPPPVVPVVEAVRVEAADHAPPVRSYGVVESFFETELAPQVGGSIVEVSEKFRVGEMVEEGDVLVRIDARDYKAALAGEKAALTEAERALAEEEVRAEQAAADWRASGRELERASDFVLRKPQLAAARGSVAAAEAAIRKARADVERTEVRAPFDAVVTGREASPGNQASPQVSLGTLVAREKVEIRLPLTAEQSARVRIPAAAELTSPLKPGVSWEASLVRLEPVVDSRNQVIYAVAEVEEPYAGAEREALPVGMFANASISGESILECYRVPEAAYVDDRFMWVIDDEEELARVEAERVFTFEGDVFLKAAEGAVAGGLRVVTRPLSNFTEGMKVRTEEGAD